LPQMIQARDNYLRNQEAYKEGKKKV